MSDDPRANPDSSATVTPGGPAGPQTNRESEPTYKRLSPLTPLVRSSILVVAVLASNWDNFLHRDVGPIAWIFLAVVVGGAVYGTASWLRTRYWIEADELRVDTGVISRQSRRIRVDRLQGIDIAQPFVARIFGLAELRMDVAGGGAREGSLAFLRLQEAQQLRETLLHRRDVVRAGRAVAGPARPPGPARPRDPAGLSVSGPVPEQVLARLDLTTLLVSLVMSPQTVAFVLAAAVLGTSFAIFGQLSGAAGVVPVFIGFALTQLRRLSAYYDFTLTTSSTAEAAGLQVRRGLFALDAQTINLSRVQGVVITEPYMWRPFGWARLDVSIAGSATGLETDGKPSASTVMPVAPRALVLALARTLLSDAGGPDPDEVPLTAPPRRARWVAPVGWRYQGVGVGEHLMVSRSGVLTRRTHVVPHARVQSLQLRQRPWQRLLGLADLRVDSPPGPVLVHARHRDTAEARDLLDRENVLSRAARRR